MMRRSSILACLIVLCGILAVMLFTSKHFYTELTFSRNSGFYEEPFSLELYAPPGTEIFYTLDGSDPDENAIRYTEPIWIEDATYHDNVYSIRTDMSTYSYTLPDFPIDKCTVVNAVYRDINGNFSEIKSGSFFVGYESKTGYDGLNIISMVTDPNNLFDYDTGIYVLGRTYDEYPHKEEITEWASSANFCQRGTEWERTAYISLFDTEKTLLLNQECGIRIQGASSRLRFPKSINIYARAQYDGRGRFYTDLFHTQYMADTITLSVGGYEMEKICDMLVSTLTTGRNFATMNYIPYALFLNGEYWGIYWMTEKYDDVYLGFYNNIDKDNIIMIKTGSLSEGEDTDYELWTEMFDYISNADLSVDSNYQYICELIDIQSFIDYYIAEIYIANSDWGSGNNEALWRSRQSTDEAYADGRWRWLLFDVDNSLTIENLSTDNISVTMENSPMFNNLCQNKDFKEQFAVTFMDMVNTCFTPEIADTVISDYVNLMKDPMEKHSMRLGVPYRRFMDSVEDAQNFLDNRKSYIVQYLKDDFDLSGIPAPVEVEINDPTAGRIVLNTIEPSFDVNGRWIGEYYTDYPITLTASANDGYRFVRWEITDSNRKETLTEDNIETNISEQGISVNAVFEKTDDFKWTLSHLLPNIRESF